MNEQNVAVAENIADFMQLKFGPMDTNVFAEIVHDDPPVSIGSIPPNSLSPVYTLFTIGMADRPMNVPEESNPESFQFAELFLQLPSSWLLSPAELNHKANRWPIDLLRELARIPHQNNSWIGGPFGVFANENATDTYAGSNAFSASFAINELFFMNRALQLIRVYRVVPIFFEEYQMLVNQGVQKFLLAMDSAGISQVVDENRKCITW